MNISAFTKQIFLCTCLAVGVNQSAIAADPSGDAALLQARQLMSSNDAAKAYTLLAPMETERAGELEYDYLLGVAALGSGKPARAIFALERFLAIDPDHAEARLQLARAYFMTGEAAASREEFETVKRQQPPDQVNRVTRQYLESINRPMAGTGIKGYLELSAGYDNNANSATTATALLFAPGFVLPLAAENRRRSDQFVSMAGGLQLQHVFSSAWSLNASSNIGQRRNDSHELYDAGYLDGSLGLTHTRGSDQVTGAVQYQKINLHNHSYRQAYGLLGQWQHSIDDARQFTTYGQVGRLAYDGNQNIRDADRHVLGASYSHGFSTAFSPVVHAGLYAGKETARRSGFVDEFGLENTFGHFGFKLTGLRLGGQLTMSPQTKLLVNARHERRRHSKENPSYASSRNDRQTDLSLSLSYVPALFWTVRPEIVYTDNRSNLDLYDYSRTQYLLTIRRDFN